MIRPTEPRDTPLLLEIARGTLVFDEPSIVALREVLDDYHEFNRELGHASVTFEHEGEAVGLAYWAPAALTDRGWYLYWIIVAKGLQGRGIGDALLNQAEAAVRSLGGRLFLIETSTLPIYEPTRRFYAKHGYERAAIIPDFYADGDSLAVYTKRFLPRADAP